jgi:hypothetical protein
LLPQIVNLTIPIVGLPLSKHYPPYHLPAAASASSSFHPDYRDPAVVPANAEAGQEEERDIEALRALVQAFEDGAGEGVKEGKGKRKGECHFLASVFANVSMVSPGRNVVHSDTDVLLSVAGYEATSAYAAATFPTSLFGSTIPRRRTAAEQDCRIYRTSRYNQAWRCFGLYQELCDGPGVNGMALSQ